MEINGNIYVEICSRSRIGNFLRSSEKKIEEKKFELVLNMHGFAISRNGVETVENLIACKKYRRRIIAG